MGNPQAARRRGLLLGCVLLCLGSWACFFFLALSSLAAAEPAPEFKPPELLASEPVLPEFAGCPEGVEEAYELTEEGSDTAARQLTLLRGELQQACHAQVERLSEVIRRLWWVVSEGVGEHDQAVETNGYLEGQYVLLENIESALGAGGYIGSELGTLASRFAEEGGLAVKLSSLPELPEGSNPIGTVDVSNHPDEASIEGVQVAQQTGNETFVSNLWGALGLLVGFGSLAFIYKLVRP